MGGGLRADHSGLGGSLQVIGFGAGLAVLSRIRCGVVGGRLVARFVDWLVGALFVVDLLVGSLLVGALELIRMRLGVLFCRGGDRR
ncbi:hypothetical protein BCY76_010345 [Nesterenkonia sp. PF2B19]|nr:hypothetical protein BCY76_010345 [Nesterenkonia sp. PF2B19]